MDTLETSGIERAIAAVGSQDNLAESLGITQQVISQWKKQGYVPTERVLEVEQLTGVSRVKLIKPSIAGLLTPAI